MTNSLENITVLENHMKQIQQIVSMLRKNSVSKKAQISSQHKCKDKPMET